MPEKVKLEVIIYAGDTGILIQDVSYLRPENYETLLKASLRMPTIKELKTIAHQLSKSIDLLEEKQNG